MEERTSQVWDLFQDWFASPYTTSEGKMIESALDHTYLSSDLITKATLSKLETSSTDHVPIVAKIDYQNRPKLKKCWKQPKGPWKSSLGGLVG